MVILGKLEGVFLVESMTCSASKLRGRGLEPWVTGVEWIQACK